MPESGSTDAELLADWLDRHREPAFHALVARYAGLVHMAAKRTCDDESLAAEASQLAFITLAQKAKSLASRSSLAGWLHLAAVMHSKNLLRHRRREVRKLQSLRMHMESYTQGPEAWQRIQPVLDEALAALSSGDRETLLLRFYRSLSVREIAANFGIATDAAQKRLDRATDRLRRQLARRGCQVGGSLGAILLAGFSSDAQAALPSSGVIASKALTVAASGTATSLTTIGILIMTKKTAITAGAAVLLLAGGGMLAMNKVSQKAGAKAEADAADIAARAAKSSSAPTGTLTPVNTEEKADRAKSRDPAQNPAFVAKYGESRTNLSKHVATQVISLLEDAVAMGEMATSGEMGNAFGGPRGGLRMGLGGLNDKLQLTEEQQEKAAGIYKDYQKRELAKSKESIERLKKDPTALMQMILASDAHTRKEMTDEEYKQLQTANEESLKGTVNPLDEKNFRGGQPLKDVTFQGDLKAVLDPTQTETLDAAVAEQATKPEPDRSLSAMPSMELEKLDQTVASAKKLTTGLKSMMEGMGGLQDLGPLMEQQRKAREGQRAAEQAIPAE